MATRAIRTISDSGLSHGLFEPRRSQSRLGDVHHLAERDELFLYTSHMSIATSRKLLPVMLFSGHFNLICNWPCSVLLEMSTEMFQGLKCGTSMDRT